MKISFSTLKEATVFLALLPLIWIGCAQAPASSPEFTYEILSGPAEYVSGNRLRVRFKVPEQVDKPFIMLGFDDAGAVHAMQFEPGQRYVEKTLSGLPQGTNTLFLMIDDHRNELTYTNYPITGPMFSGPPQEPFFCATEEDRARARLGEILDDQCSMETQVDFLYLSSKTNEFVPYDPSAPRPADMAQTTTLDSSEVDFIIRWERGTINRFIYSIAVLSPESQISESTDLSAWNDRLIYYFQGGVGVGHYQGSPSPDRMLYKHGLSQGYAIAYSTGTRTAVHYDLQLGAETALMLKSHFIVNYGAPLYTVGVGGSGGAIQQYVYGQNHTGLIDAAIPQYAYPDMVSQGIHVADCELLERYMDAEVEKDPESKWATWSNRTWLQGMNASDTLPNKFNGDQPGLTECINGWRGLSALSFNPHYGTAPGISREDQASTIWTHMEDMKQVYGMADDGYAARTWDNVGVQYGLRALNTGQISGNEFLDLNARIGGWKNETDMVQEGGPYLPEAEDFDPYSARNMTLSPDDSGYPPAPRSVADPGAIDSVYKHGMVFTGKLDIPIIDWRHYLEPILDMHNSHQSFATRQRMLNHDNDADNQIIWFTEVSEGKDRYDQTPMAFDVIDEWMLNIKANPSRSVAENKPARAADSCFDSDGQLIHSGPDSWSGILDDAVQGPCTTRFPIYGTSRIVAGAPITGDIFKCHLQSIDDAIDHGLYGSWTPSPEEKSRLEEIFPSGVCDYSHGEGGQTLPLP